MDILLTDRVTGKPGCASPQGTQTDLPGAFPFCETQRGPWLAAIFAPLRDRANHRAYRIGNDSLLTGSMRESMMKPALLVEIHREAPLRR